MLGSNQSDASLALWICGVSFTEPGDWPKRDTRGLRENGEVISSASSGIRGSNPL